MRCVTRLLVIPAILSALCNVAHADPPANPNVPTVFCFRFTDIERVDDAEGDRFQFEFEVLNWTDTEAAGLNLALNVGTSPGVTLFNASIDPDGRGGDTNTNGQIGAGVSDSVSHQSGRGRGDIDEPNDWNVRERTSSAVTFDALDVDTGSFLTGTQIPNQDLLFTPGNPFGLIPGLGVDDLDDSAIDGGPGPYTDPTPPPPFPTGGPPEPDGSGNVLDGFVIDVDGFGVGDTISFNWFLLGFAEDDVPSGPSVAALTVGEVSNLTVPEGLVTIGTAGGGNSFGFGTISLARTIEGGEPPGALFVGNTGFNQNPELFFDNVFNVPNPTDFHGELGAGITAPFLNDADNTFDAPVNTSVIPEPGSVVIWVALAAVAAGLGWRRRRWARA